MDDYPSRIKIETNYMANYALEIIIFNIKLIN